MPRPCVPAALLALAAAATPLPLQAAPPGSSLEQELREATLALQRVWQHDPVSAGRPFPAVRLEAAIDPKTCPAAPFPASRALLLVCPAPGELLLDRQALESNRAVFEAGAVAFVVAYGLGQLLGSPLPPGAEAPAATAGLQAACRAGTLLAGTVRGDRQAQGQWLEAAIRTAAQGLDSSASGQLGTAPQRAYAVLSGIGSTELDCSSAAMARLAAGQVPVDPHLGTRGFSVGMELFCRQPPSCPRRLRLDSL
ncbi:MAG: hypothetical protein VKN13_06685 [Cyanobacteriota bacterium]|nr:hypothetical protein [Cyanobacteriota bacterium]